MDMATAMGVEILTEEQCRALQKLEDFDNKRRAGSRHLLIFKLGGTLFTIFAMDTSSSITTVQTPTIVPEGFMDH